MSRETECRACASRALAPVLSLGTQPLANALLESRDAPDEKRYPLGGVRDAPQSGHTSASLAPSTAPLALALVMRDGISSISCGRPMELSSLAMSSRLTASANRR